jgi:hypothetical protein
MWPGNLVFQQPEIARAFGHVLPGHRCVTESIGSALELLDSFRSYEGAAILRGGLPRCALCIPASLVPALALFVQPAAVARKSRPQRAAASADCGTTRC